MPNQQSEMLLDGLTKNNALILLGKIKKKVLELSLKPNYFVFLRTKEANIMAQSMKLIVIPLI
jgi:hypothetical protein